MKQILAYFNTGQFWNNLKTSFLLRENMQIIVSILLFITFIYIVISILYKVISLLAKGGVEELKKYIEQFSFKSLTLAFNFLTILIMLLSVSLAYESIENTLNVSTNQLEQSEKLYELQNRPIISVKEVEWYPRQVQSGDIGLKIDVHIVNDGKSLASEAKIIKDVVLRIRTDTLSRFPNFIEDVNTASETLDIDKDKRFYEKYMPYRRAPFEDINKYILENRGDVTSDSIIKHFSEDYKQKGYTFIPYADLNYRGYFIFPPGETVLITGRSVSVVDFENDILKDGGDILIFYYAIEYKGPLKIKKYITHNIVCYDSFFGSKIKNKDGKYNFTYKSSILDEIEPES